MLLNLIILKPNNKFKDKDDEEDEVAKNLEYNSMKSTTIKSSSIK